MNQSDMIIPDLVGQGYAKNTAGIFSATKRGGQWIETSIDDFRATVRHVALGLYALGLRKGDRITLHSENCTEWLIVDLATLSLGAVTVPIYTTQPGDQIKYILENSEARIHVVSTQKLYDALAPYLNDITTLEHTIGILGTYHPDMLSLAEVQEKGQAKEQEAPDLFDSLYAEVQPSDLASLIYTSGTTGLPKGVMLSHNNLVSNILASHNRSAFDPTEHRGKNVLSYLPLSHVFERMVGYMYLFMGHPIYFVETYEEIMEDFQTIKPVHFTTVPRLLEKIYTGIHAKAKNVTGLGGIMMRQALNIANAYDVAQPTKGLRYTLADKLVFQKIRQVFGGNLQAITSGGAALSPKIMNFFNALGIFCAQGYGMTESSPVITTYQKGDLKAGSAGKPIEKVEVKIEEDGEILTRGPHVMMGYYKLPEQTREVLTEDGWLHTGDIGHFDNDGHLYITDRKKQLLKLSTGKYVAPQPIEVSLSTSAFIEQVVVIGNERKFCSALVVLDYKAVSHYLSDLTEEELLQHPRVIDLIQQEIDNANTGLPHWERIKKFHLLKTPFSIEGGELTPTLKIKRRVVQDKYRDAIDRLYG